MEYGSSSKIHLFRINWKFQNPLTRTIQLFNFGKSDFFVFVIQDFYRNELLNFQEIIFETEFDFCLSSEQFDFKARWNDRIEMPWNAIYGS